MLSYDIGFSSLNIGHFCGKWPIMIRDPMRLSPLCIMRMCIWNVFIRYWIFLVKCRICCGSRKPYMDLNANTDYRALVVEYRSLFVGYTVLFMRYWISLVKHRTCCGSRKPWNMIDIDLNVVPDYRALSIGYRSLFGGYPVLFIDFKALFTE